MTVSNPVYAILMHHLAQVKAHVPGGHINMVTRSAQMSAKDDTACDFVVADTSALQEAVDVDVELPLDDVLLVVYVTSGGGGGGM